MDSPLMRVALSLAIFCMIIWIVGGLDLSFVNDVQMSDVAALGRGLIIPLAVAAGLFVGTVVLRYVFRVVVARLSKAGAETRHDKKAVDA